MKVALSLEDFTVPGGPGNIGPVVARIAEDADRAGLAQLWVMDHFFQIPFIGEPEREMLEGYEVLSYAAARTQRIELGTLVTGVAHRHPGVLVKTVTTLDVLSGGRAWLGIGASWNEMESRSLGIPFPPLGERFERLEETLRIATQMWSGDEGRFESAHYSLERPMNSPNSIRRPHPPILIGGNGERKTLRLVAQYADACNLLPMHGGADTLRHKLDVLRAHCEAIGRPYAEISKTAMIRLSLAPGNGGREDAIRQMRELAEIGFDGVVVSIVEVHQPGAVDVLGEIAASVADLVPEQRQAVAA